MRRPSLRNAPEGALLHPPERGGTGLAGGSGGKPSFGGVYSRPAFGGSQPKTPRKPQAQGGRTGDCPASGGLKSSRLSPNVNQLAKGDRRDFVAIDHTCEVYAVAKWTGVKTKDVAAKLGEPDGLPTVEQARIEMAKAMAERLTARRWMLLKLNSRNAGMPSTSNGSSVSRQAGAAGLIA